MAYYRAYLLDEDRRVVAVAKFHCADDQAAKERAQEVNSNDVELWQLDRRIAVFRRLMLVHGRPEWHPIASAPYGVDLELAVIKNGTHALVFPCRRTRAGWLKYETDQWVDLRPTHWREWNASSARGRPQAL